MRNTRLVMVLLSILAGAVVCAYEGLSEGDDSSIGVHGRIAMFLSISFSIVGGVGLMTLVFYSRRRRLKPGPLLSKSPCRRAKATLSLDSDDCRQSGGQRRGRTRDARAFRRRRDC